MGRKKLLVLGCLTAITIVWVTASSRLDLQAAQQRPAANSAAQQRALLDQYCVGCHNERFSNAGVKLDSVDLTKATEHAEVLEKVIRKVKAEMMPPVGSPRPDKAAMEALAAFLETSLDRAAATNPRPGDKLLHRMNRTEYGNAVRDLFDLQEVNVSALLPPDNEARGFDNIADALGMNPALMDRYIQAAWKIVALATGDTNIPPIIETFPVRSDLAQREYIEGMPLGTRGGVVIDHFFPVDGEYLIRAKLWKTTVTQTGGLEVPDDGEVTVDGERLTVARFGGSEDEIAAAQFPDTTGQEIDNRFNTRVTLKAGTHRVTVGFLKKSSGPSIALLSPFERDRIDPVAPVGVPLIERVTIEGPFNVKGSGDSASRRRIFTCRPAAGSDGMACAKTILTTLGRRAYRRPLTTAETDRLLRYYQSGQTRSGGDFDSGIREALAFLLVSPQFLFRFERDPQSTASNGVVTRVAAQESQYRISDLELASRLSFFLWSSIPDDQLLDLAIRGRLKQPAVLEQQVKRMLADERARALGANFVGQWLFLRNIAGHMPDQDIFPDFDDNLRKAMPRETELLFEGIVLEDRSVLELLTADYTYLNERLAKHYGVRGVYGTQYRKVAVTDETRKGILGHAGILTLTSYANRTNPVNRGKYVLTNILGTPPPPPPPNVPPLNESPGRVLSMRERMAAHRANTVCANCHKLMDPIGLSLENFDAIGRWRTTDNGATIDPTDTLYNGEKVDGPVALRQVILRHPDQFVRTMTENLMTYALGRGVEYYDMPIIRSILKDAARNNYRFSSVVLGIVKSGPFQMRSRGSEDSKPVADNGAERPVVITSASNTKQ
jgi:mono/diheme cytochrome c family protein